MTGDEEPQGLTMDEKRKSNAKHFMENCTQQARAVFTWHLHDVRWENCFCDERLLYSCGRLWLGSVSDVVGSGGSLHPLAGEDYIAIDWALRLTEENQHLVWQRLTDDYMDSTATVAVDRKKTIRAKKEQTKTTVDAVVFWWQTRSFLKNIMGPEDFSRFDNGIFKHSRCDQDFQDIL